MKVDGLDGRQGVWLVGEWRGWTWGRAWVGRDGTEHRPVHCHVLTGRFVRKVECGSYQDMVRVLGGREPEVGEVVALPVQARGPWDAEVRRRGPVFWSLVTWGDGGARGDSGA
jgi:hypothetical protein